MDNRLVRAATTTSSLEAKQDSGNIAKTQSKATPNESSSQRTDSGDGPRRQDTIGDAVAYTMSERVSKSSNDPLLNKVLALEATKTTQVQEIDSLKRRVKKLKKKQRSRTHKHKRLYKVGLSARVESFDDEGLEMFDADKDLQGEEVVVEQDVVADKEPIVDVAQVSAVTTTITIDDITLAKALKALKTSKTMIKGIVIKDHEEPSESRTTTTISSKKLQDKGKAKMIEKPVKMKKKDQILFDKEIARKLQEDINEEERLVGERARQEEESNIILIETWEDIQAKVDADYQLAERLKFFAAMRDEEKRNRPPIKAHQRSIMCIYLKNMKGYELNGLKNKSFADIQNLFDKAMKRVNTFVDYITELVEESSKKVKAEITQDEQVKIIPKEDIAIDDIHLANKTPIVDWKIYKERKKSYYQIIRAGGKSKNYLVFSYMLKDFDREDVETLWKLVKAKVTTAEELQRNYSKCLRLPVQELRLLLEATAAKVDEDSRQESECHDQEKLDNVNSTNNVNVAGINRVSIVGINTSNELPFDLEMPDLEDISAFNFPNDHEDEELLQFKLQEVWTLVDLPYGKRAIDFVVYQMDVKSVFLYGKIEEEVYVCQHPGFKDPDFLEKVYKVEKALYGLHQAPRAWYETLSTYLLDNGFHRGKIDKTLFIRRHKDGILLVQVYVDDVIFCSTKKELCNEFEKMTHEKF
nr:putative ribonuclease H-like domain-containing protein [Tanacetum cinerariifolium]